MLSDIINSRICPKIIIPSKFKCKTFSVSYFHSFLFPLLYLDYFKVVLHIYLNCCLCIMCTFYCGFSILLNHIYITYINILANSIVLFLQWDVYLYIGSKDCYLYFVNCRREYLYCPTFES